jgi:hypothetical protein
MIDVMGEAAEKLYAALADAGFDVLSRLGPHDDSARIAARPVAFKATLQQAAARTAHATQWSGGG